MEKVVVILGGGLINEAGIWQTIDFGKGSDNFAPSNDRWRVEAGAVFWKEHKDWNIVASGGKGQFSDIPGVPTISEVIKKELVELGVSGDVILKEEKSGNTLEQLQELEDLVNKYGFKEIKIISNEWQMPRIKAIFNLYPGLKDSFSKVTVDFVSAEDILIENNPNFWKEKIEIARKDSDMKKRFDLEKQGVEQIENGTYKFKSYKSYKDDN